MSERRPVTVLAKSYNSDGVCHCSIVYFQVTRFNGNIEP
jgi:hypothetical protein